MKCIQCNENEPNKESGLCHACEKAEASKINGLLYLPAAGLIFSLIFLPVEFFDLISAISAYFSRSGIITWYAAGAVVLLVALIGITAYASWHFFQRKRHTPRAMVIYYLAGVVSALWFAVLPVSLFGASWDNSSIRSVLSAFIGVTCWLPYFLKSPRIAQVFVR
ncbi:DUF2569 domain-containing protein [Cronobacter sakazakii]|uniref:DUF2569 domain-containing protein n=2 Tax=Cronobacter TaxID=413496 RepID=V5U326_9ENTR|nr:MULTISPECIES: DUF2569 domain-containing protein [Cronobacter]CCJ95429.1 FIG00554217: hypothetical protein [Cronobacter malonaticus 681]AHB71936.1 hypothetical protein P262_05026 [Cronobacter malonaticus]ALX80022.1 hypothetical protein AFK66_016975 [Cronobacter malonaticus LMG 23826]EGT4279255.1 DUF2569 domain-containing protein [Cronobacter malonaticus]EGT4289318.1 DUF2569 domain-containing protein [Cronobacter malonaticus]